MITEIIIITIGYAAKKLVSHARKNTYRRQVRASTRKYVEKSSHETLTRSMKPSFV